MAQGQSMELGNDEIPNIQCIDWIKLLLALVVQLRAFRLNSNEHFKVLFVAVPSHKLLE